MLLNHFGLGLMVLCFCFFAQSEAKAFKTGLMQLTSSLSQSSYTINEDKHLNQIIIVISTFSSIQALTSCFIVSRQSYQINFNCTQNVQSVSYLLYEKTPLIYSNVFTYYFFKNDKKASTVWQAPVELTLIKHSAIRGLLSGFLLDDVRYAKIQLQTMQNGSAINISRTLNVKVVNFSFILVQNYASYNLIFAEVPIWQFRRMVFQGWFSNTMNFWGIGSLNFEKTNQTNEVFQKIVEKNRKKNEDFIELIQFYTSEDVLIKGIFLISKQQNSSQCPQFYNPSRKSCQSICSAQNTINWSTSEFQFRYCLVKDNQTLNFLKNYQRLNYTNNNLQQLVASVGKGCLKAAVNEQSDIVCQICKPQYVLYKDRCVCKYGFVESQGVCRQCYNTQCEIYLDTNYKIIEVNFNKVNIKITGKLLNDVIVLQNKPKDHRRNLTINGIMQQIQITYATQTQELHFQVFNISKQSKYQIRLQESVVQSEQVLMFLEKMIENATSQSSLFFLWKYSMNMTIQASLSSTTILKQTSEIIKHSQKTIPLVYFLGFMIGDKINAFSLFQTVSLIYLVNFIQFKQEYDDLRTLMKQIFIFQPKPLWNFVQKWNFYQIFTITQDVEYDPLVYQYSEGKLLLSTCSNAFISLLLQILAFLLLISFFKKYLEPSSNQIAPINTQLVAVSRKHESKTNEVIQRQSFKQTVKSKETVRVRLYKLFSSVFKKRYINITTIMMVQQLSFTYLALYEVRLPMFNIQAIISRIFSMFVIILILGYPLLLISYEPLLLLKCCSIFKKKLTYKRGEIWMYFFLTYNESITYAILFIILNNSIAKISAIISIQLLKIVCFRKVLKNVEIIKICSTLLFFISILLLLILPTAYSSILTQICILTILLILLTQLLKFMRSLIIFILNIFKGLQVQQNIQSSSNQLKNKKHSIYIHFEHKFQQSNQRRNKLKQKCVNILKNRKEIQAAYYLKQQLNMHKKDCKLT